MATCSPHHGPRVRARRASRLPVDVEYRSPLIHAPGHLPVAVEYRSPLIHAPRHLRSFHLAAVELAETLLGRWSGQWLFVGNASAAEQAATIAMCSMTRTSMELVHGCFYTRADLCPPQPSISDAEWL
jgi:hypothetical protein